MKNCFARYAVSAFLFGLAVVTSATSAHSEELEVKGALAKPVLFVSAASVEQLVGEFNYAMDAIERHDIVKNFEEFRESSENLKGMDLTRPVGGMLLLEYLSPVWIGFIPIRDWDHFRETLEEFELKIEETGSNQYLIRGFGMDLFGVVRDGYLYVSDQKAGLKRRVPNPEEYAKQLHEDYDLAITGQLTVIPEFLLTTAADWTLAEIVVSDESEKADAAPQTQDKIDEFAERLFRDGMLTLFKETQRVTLGWSVNRQERQARLDLVLAAKPGSVLARQLNTLKTANPRIGRCLSPEAAVNATATFDYNATFREFQSAFVDFVRADEVAAEDKDECDREIENLLADIVGKIFPGERIDAALQYDGAPGAGVMLVGWSIPEGDQLQKSIGELLARTADAEGDDEEADTGFVEEYRGRSIYEVDDAGEADDAIFGKGARTYFAVSSDAVWIAMGGEQALPTLKKALDASADQPQASADRAPLDVTIHGAKVQVYGEGTDDEDAREIAERAFKDSDDRIRIELTGIENGMRLRSSVGEAFVRLAALAAVKGLEDAGLLKK